MRSAAPTISKVTSRYPFLWRHNYEEFGVDSANRYARRPPVLR
jgi:hypothetical protein